jgi:hypothetical protein
MEKIILKYLDKNYYLYFQSITKFKIYCRINNETSSINDIFEELTKFFLISNKQFIMVFDKWIDEKSIVANVQLLELQMFYSTLGYRIDYDTNEVHDIFINELKFGTETMRFLNSLR